MPTTIRDHLRFKKGQKPRLDDEVRPTLAERFAPDLERLERLLEHNLDALREMQSSSHLRRNDRRHMGVFSNRCCFQLTWSTQEMQPYPA